MTGVYVGGGFESDATERLPEPLPARAEVADGLDWRERDREARRAADRAALFEQNSIRASIVEAEERGEWFSPRTAWANGGVGRTRGEFLAWIIGQQEAEDARAEWAERREFEACRRRRQEGAYADTTAPSKAEVAEQQQVAARAAEQAAQRHERVVTVRQARAMTRWDRKREKGDR
jgi:hypothetical protein